MTPVMLTDSGAAKNTTVWAESDGRPSDCVGINDISLARNSGLSFLRPGVSLRARCQTVDSYALLGDLDGQRFGHADDARLGRGVRHRPRDKPATAHSLDRRYVYDPTKVWLIIDGKAALVTLKTELRLRSIWLIQVSWLISWKKLITPPPALLTRMSIAPHSPTISAIEPATAS